ncbi:MAG TPA: serine hydrolase domain-containing protein [Dongiaceae bacterium]|nr:serine hydrolase domain-containing protein [Dongiaceae bacterium]
MIRGYVHPAFAGVASELGRQIPDNGRSGAAVAVYHQGQCVVDIWGGSRDHEGNPWQEDTLALSFSTTKGVASTLLHVLADQGLIDYHKPVIYYWPEFAQSGKGDITVLHLLCHQAGLYDIRGMIDDATRISDWEYMTDTLAAATPVHRPGEAHGYHGITYGWLIGELIQRVTGKSFAEVLHSQLVQPLGLDGLYVGLPQDQFYRRAYLPSFPRSHRTLVEHEAARPKRKPNLQSRLQMGLIRGAIQLAGVDPDNFTRGLAPHGMARFSFNDDSVISACIPAANGMFTARSLARLYAVMANDGELEGVRLMSPQRVRQVSQIQSRKMDRVVPIPMHWRLGYHRVFTTGPRTPNAFGHFGFQGSGAWCDPSRHLAVGFIVNSAGGTTPFGDDRIARINSAAIRAAEKVEGVRSPLGLVPFFS